MGSQYHCGRAARGGGALSWLGTYFPLQNNWTPTLALSVFINMLLFQGAALIALSITRRLVDTYFPVYKDKARPYGLVDAPFFFKISFRVSTGCDFLSSCHL